LAEGSCLRLDRNETSFPAHGNHRAIQARFFGRPQNDHARRSLQYSCWCDALRGERRAQAQAELGKYQDAIAALERVQGSSDAADYDDVEELLDEYRRALPPSDDP
jgi:hypothetical protein